MKLVPSRPPGRSTRRAGAFAVQIRQLRTDGYTFEAIREALAGAGIAVSLSTVQREVARTALPSRAAAPGSEQETPQTPALALQSESARPTPRLSGREIAEEFVRLHPTNPLLKPKDPR